MPAARTTSVEEYLRGLPAERSATIRAVRDVVLRNLPRGYVEGMEYGMIYYHVPLSRYPETYNGHPLCYAGLAAQKNYCSLYLMGVYGNATTAKAFREGFAREGKKLDMGKSCVRFKTVDDLPLTVVGQAIAAVPVDAYIALYEKSRLKTKAGQRKAAKKSTRRK